MEKITIIAIVVAVLLIGGVIYTSADFLEEEEEIVEPVEQVCGPNTCNQQCGGDCGVPSCGCSRG